MLPTSSRLLICAILLITSGTAAGQEVLDLLGSFALRNQLHVSAYNPRVPPQVLCIRSDEEASAFCAQAWNEEKKELHIDFTREQILVVAWGALRWAEGSTGFGIEIHLEKLTILEDTLRATVRTVLPPGPGIDIAADQAGRTWYPSLFVRTPRTDRVVVDLIGARRREPAADFRPVATKLLEVRIAPDACPARERITMAAPRPAAFDKPQITLEQQDDKTLLYVAWGKLGAGAYRLELVGMSIDEGIARLRLRADNREIVVYSGPGEHHPQLAVALPKVTKVLLDIDRVGVPLAEVEEDFADQASEELVVTVDRSVVFVR